MQAGCQGFRKQRAGFSLTVPPSPAPVLPLSSLPFFFLISFPFLLSVSFVLTRSTFMEETRSFYMTQVTKCREIQGVTASCYQCGFYSAHPRLHELCTIFEWPLTAKIIYHSRETNSNSGRLCAITAPQKHFGQRTFMRLRG